jgi:hypothetical protein
VPRPTSRPDNDASWCWRGGEGATLARGRGAAFSRQRGQWRSQRCQGTPRHATAIRTPPPHPTRPCGSGAEAAKSSHTNKREEGRNRRHAPAMNLKSAAPVMTPSNTYTAALTGSMATAMGSTSRTAAITSAARTRSDRLGFARVRMCMHACVCVSPSAHVCAGASRTAHVCVFSWRPGGRRACRPWPPPLHRLCAPFALPPLPSPPQPPTSPQLGSPPQPHPPCPHSPPRFAPAH